MENKMIDKLVATLTVIAFITPFNDAGAQSDSTYDYLSDKVAEYITENTGTVTGNVYDTEHNPISASIYIEDLDYCVSTDDGGYFKIEYLPVGYYDIFASKIGYIKYKASDVPVIRGGEMWVPFYLEKKPEGLELGFYLMELGGEGILDVKRSAAYITMTVKKAEKDMKRELSTEMLINPEITKYYDTDRYGASVEYDDADIKLKTEFSILADGTVIEPRLEILKGPYQTQVDSDNLETGLLNIMSGWKFPEIEEGDVHVKLDISVTSN